MMSDKKEQVVESIRLSVSQREAAKFYFREFYSESRLYWVYLPLIMLQQIIVWRIPALLIAYLVSDLQAGRGADWQQTIAIAIGLAVIGQLLSSAVWTGIDRFQLGMVRKVYVSSYAKLLRQSLGFHADNFAGALGSKISRLSDGVIDFYQFFVYSFGSFLASLVFAVFVIGQDGLFAVFLLFASFILYGLVTSILIRKQNKLRDVSNELESRRTGELVDGLTNVFAVKSFAQEYMEAQRFDKHTHKATSALKQVFMYWIWQINSLTMFFYIAIAYLPLVYVFSIHGTDDFGRVFIVFYALDMLASKVWDINRMWRTVSQTLGHGSEALHVLQQPVAVEDSVDSVELKVKEPHILLENVGFYYEKNELYKDFSLRISAHEKIGLVGPSGGGKTTLVKLLMRFMDINDGHIRIDGQDIAQVTQDSLRDNIAFIPQEPVLFHRSLRENILYGKPGASDDEMIAAAKKAHAHEFIVGLPDGYDTMVGERGVKLSGGQRQRVAIARMFLKDAPILILDEATSALDSESEKYIQDSLVELMKGKTVLSIAHRLSTLQIMDKLVVIEDGAIAESGTHTELMKQEGVYARLWAHQSGDYLDS